MKLPFPRRFKAWLVALVSLTAVAVVSIAPMMRPRAQAPPPSYTFTDLGTLGGSYSRALGINNCGQVVGEASVTGASPTHPFIWRDSNGNLVSDAGEMKNLGSLGGARGLATDINASGLVVGTSTILNGDERAFRWFDLDGDGTPDPGEMNDLGVLPNHSTYGAFGVNDNGQIVGTTEGGDGVASGFIWNANTGLQLLATLGGIKPSHGYAINNSSHIAGYARNIDHAFIYNGTTNLDLGTLGPLGPVSIAYDINAAGHAVGFADLDNSTGSPPSHAFKWNGALPLQDLGVLAGGARSEASSINSSGTVVGYSEVTGGAWRAFVHYDNQMYDLNTLTTPTGWTSLDEARGINDGGQIVGYGTTTGGETHAFLLTPTTFTPGCSPTVTVTVSPASVNEDGAPNLIYTFTRAPVTSTAMTVNFSTSGSATPVVDYALSGAGITYDPNTGSGIVAFAAGEITKTVTVNPATDFAVETNETVVLTTVAGTGYIVGTPTSATGTITNDDSIPSVSVAVSPSATAEDGAPNLVYTFTRSSTGGSLTVNFSVNGSADASTDYAQSGAASFTPPTGSVTFADGSNTATVTVNPNTDSTVESDETVILAITTHANYTVVSPSTATGTITNDDTNVSVAVSPASVSEDGGPNLVYTFTRTGVTTGPLTVNFSVAATATLNDDYSQTGAATFSSTAGTVTFSAGNSSATVTLDPTPDSTVESDETVNLTISPNAAYTIAAPPLNAATGTITNDDTNVSVAVSPASVSEDGATNLVYTFTRTGLTNAITVNFSVGGTADASTDYVQTGAASFTPPTGTVTFGAGALTATVTLNPTTDATAETDETAILTVTSGTGYSVVSPSAATGTITNDDTNVSVTVSPASVSEDGVTNLVYTFTRTGLTNAITVDFSVAGSATLNTDYSQAGAASFNTSAGTVTLPAGISSATVTLDPTPDFAVESDDTVILTVTTGAGYTVGSPSAATGTITNDDSLPSVSVAVSPLAAAEDGATDLVYTFTRSSTGGSLTVNFSVGGTADTSDYAQSGAASFTPPTGSVTFANGSNTATVTVNPNTDSTVESDETVIFTITTDANYTVGSPSGATGTITNDDSLPSVSVAVSPLTAAEDGAANLVYTFTRTGVITGALTVNFSVAGTATLDTDYSQTGAASFLPTTGSVSFAAGSNTASVTVNPTTDTTVEFDETVTLTILPNAAYTIAAAPMDAATGTITNDDTDVTVTVLPTFVTESGVTNMIYTFTRNGVTAGALTVNFSVGGTATFLDDYTESGAATFSAASGTVTLGDTNSSATVTINPATDTLLEGDETVILTVTTGAGYNVANPNSATGTITPDAPSIILETASLACPLGNCAAAVDSVTFARGPFRLINNLNFSEDRLTRVILFTSPLGMTDANLATPNLLSVHINGYANPLPIEHVGPITGVTGLSASYIIVKLPAELSTLNPPPGPNYLILTVKMGSATSNQALLILTP